MQYQSSANCINLVENGIHTQHLVGVIQINELRIGTGRAERLIFVDPTHSVFGCRSIGKRKGDGLPLAQVKETLACQVIVSYQTDGSVLRG